MVWFQALSFTVATQGGFCDSLATMIVDLVEATMPDGLRLHGALHAPPAVGFSRPPLPIDAVVCLHGTGSNFYGSSLWAGLIPQMLEWGVPVLTVNTRGHDGISSSHGAPNRRLLGSAYELVDDCRFDVAGWVQWLAARGHSRIALLGHSLGAVKAVYALAHEPQPTVRCVLAISPPRLSYSYFKETVRGPGFLEEVARAEALVATGQEEALMDVRFPLPYSVTASGYLDKYGPAERYNVLKFVQRVTCPMFFAYGTVELQYGIAFQGMPDALEQVAAAGANLRVGVVAGGDHNYAGVCPELSSRLRSFVRTLASTDQDFSSI